ncbi:MAG TPA: PQQ-binding-like beta-propeller repeat protein [Kineosporiaceae bacterium]|nr:PQQ-binding-like beta-propeller repeat protein [Kineosporiaceae bacterium]
MARWRGRWPVPFVAAASLLAGCTSGSAPMPLPTATTAAPGEVPQLWERRDLSPIGQPVSAAGTAVAYVESKDHLYVVALDPQTGRSLWQQEISLSAIPPGVVTEPVLAGDRVAYLRPAPGGGVLARVVLADVRTGRDVAAGPDGQFSAPPFPCPGSTDVCVSYSAGDGRWGLYRLQAATGRFVAELPAAGLVRQVGPEGLVNLSGGRDPETLARVRDGRTVWRLAVADAFGAGFSVEAGWQWTRFAAGRIYVGSAVRPPAQTPAGRATDLATGLATVGIDETTGKVLWREVGTWSTCLTALRWASDPGQAQLPVRCRYRGTQVARYVPARGRVVTTYQGLDVTVEGFDLATGRTTWSLPVGADHGFLGEGDAPTRVGPTTALVQTSAGPVVLDLARGSRSPAAPAAYWCPRYRNFQHYYSYRIDGSDAYTRTGGQTYFRCTERGTWVEQRPTAAITGLAGIRFGTVQVLASGSLQAFRIG